MMGNYHVRFLGGKGWQQPDLPGNHGGTVKTQRLPEGVLKRGKTSLIRPAGALSLFCKVP